MRLDRIRLRYKFTYMEPIRILKKKNELNFLIFFLIFLLLSFSSFDDPKDIKKKEEKEINSYEKTVDNNKHTKKSHNHFQSYAQNHLENVYRTFILLYCIKIELFSIRFCDPVSHIFFFQNTILSFCLT